MAVDAQSFAREWQDAWNAHDLPRLLGHYTDDVIFRSRKAESLVGAGEIRGKEALGRYRAKALAARPDLRFTIREVFQSHEMLLITYENHRGGLAAETLMVAAASGLVWQASACHAAP